MVFGRIFSTRFFAASKSSGSIDREVTLCVRMGRGYYLLINLSNTS